MTKRKEDLNSGVLDSNLGSTSTGHVTLERHLISMHFHFRTLIITQSCLRIFKSPSDFEPKVTYTELLFIKARQVTKDIPGCMTLEKKILNPPQIFLFKLKTDKFCMFTSEAFTRPQLQQNEKKKKEDNKIHWANIFLSRVKWKQILMTAFECSNRNQQHFHCSASS